ncbi:MULTISPECIES: hypothetical protein [unclassified Pseudoalteromonas]|uniref:hypothetical protein n=1 Tax=unclassified Pseudoalteromonas TaxID=194690 RepID=UPI0020983E7D|nr:hypothetical protein [Pseudoalteromonas sp. XMcav2-N]MCO7190161.1 hypothetical protein [Pseudoalteromonas sp. XMcav2-N]
MDVLSHIVVDHNHLMNIFIWFSLVLAVFASRNSPNVRWVACSILLARTIGILIYGWALTTEGWFYLIMSVQDAALILLIVKRHAVASVVAGLRLGALSQFAKECLSNFKMTSNELMYVLILSVSVLVNILALIEREIRKFTEFNPMFIYNAYEPIKLVLTLFAVLAIMSLTIDAVRGFYSKDKVGEGQRQ